VGVVHPESPGHTGLAGADPSWVFAQVNIWVCSLLSRAAAVSSLGQFEARYVYLVDLGFPGLNQPDR
jgi:hypothetical protein